MKLSTLLDQYRALRRSQHDLIQEGTTWRCCQCSFCLERDGDTVRLVDPGERHA